MAEYKSKKLNRLLQRMEEIPGAAPEKVYVVERGYIVTVNGSYLRRMMIEGNEVTFLETAVERWYSSQDYSYTTTIDMIDTELRFGVYKHVEWIE